MNLLEHKSKLEEQIAQVQSQLQQLLGAKAMVEHLIKDQEDESSESKTKESKENANTGSDK